MHDQESVPPPRPDSIRSRGRTPRAFVVGAFLLGALVAVAVGCSSDDAGPDTTAAPTSTETTAATDATATTLSDEAFADASEDLTERVAAAGGDLCAVVVAVVGAPEAQPSTTEQIREAVAAQVAVFRQLAASTPEDETNAAVVEATANRLEEVAAEAGYPVDLYGRPEVVEIVQGDEFVGAVQTYFERAAQDCPEVADELGAVAPTG